MKITGKSKFVSDKRDFKLNLHVQEICWNVLKLIEIYGSCEYDTPDMLVNIKNEEVISEKIFKSCSKYLVFHTVDFVKGFDFFLFCAWDLSSL